MVYEKPEAVPIMLRNPDPDVVDQLRRQHRIEVWTSRAQIPASACGALTLGVGAWRIWDQDPFVAGLMLVGMGLLVLSASTHLFGSAGIFGAHHRNDPTMCWVHLYDRVPPGPYELPPGHDL